MIWLFIIALMAWITYWVAANTDFDQSPMVAWWSVIVAGLTLVLIAGNFAFMEGPFPILPLSWETADGTRKTVGVAAPVVLAYDAFALLGPIGNAFLWGFFGLWCFKKAFDGGWYRGALDVRRLDDLEDKTPFPPKLEVWKICRQAEQLRKDRDANPPE